MQVEVASSASEALELLASGRHYDIGIVDLQMPRIDGLILAQKIHNLPQYRQLPLILSFFRKKTPNLSAG